MVKLRVRFEYGLGSRFWVCKCLGLDLWVTIMRKQKSCDNISERDLVLSVSKGEINEVKTLKITT